MSTKTLDSLDLVPEKTRKGGPLASIVAVIDALSEGFTAAHEYQTLIARGVQPERAARIVFDAMSWTENQTGKQ